MPVRESGTLHYRFGSLDKEGDEKAVELVYPASKSGSMKQFFGATYTHNGTYVQSIRFAAAQYSYTVYTANCGSHDEEAGVKVLNRITGEVTGVSCSERPRFYIFKFAGKLPCDPETPVDKACIQ